jgi:hypothetical protein
MLATVPPRSHRRSSGIFCPALAGVVRSYEAPPIDERSTGGLRALQRRAVPQSQGPESHRQVRNNRQSGFDDCSRSLLDHRREQGRERRSRSRWWLPSRGSRASPFSCAIPRVCDPRPRFTVRSRCRRAHPCSGSRRRIAGCRRSGPRPARDTDRQGDRPYRCRIGLLSPPASPPSEAQFATGSAR